MGLKSQKPSYMGLFGTIWDYMGLFGTIWDFLGQKVPFHKYPENEPNLQK